MPEPEARPLQPTIRSFDLAHLAHVELLTPKPDESLRFFVDVMGMTESGRRGESVYLRGWDDYEHHTLKLTAAKVAGMGHFAYRATSPEALQRRVRHHREGRPRQGLDRGRSRPRAGLRLHHARRPRHGDLLRDRVVQAAAGAEALAQEPGAALSRPRRQRAPARPPEPAHLRRRRAAAVHGGRARPAHHRDDRARQRPGGRRLGHDQQQELRPRLHARPLRRQGALPPRHLRARLARGDPARRRHLPRGRRAHRDRAAQARHPADVLPLRLRARRQPRRGRQRRRAPDAGARLAAGGVDREPSARRARRGASRRSRASTPTARRRSSNTRGRGRNSNCAPSRVLRASTGSARVWSRFDRNSAGAADCTPRRELVEGRAERDGDQPPSSGTTHSGGSPRATRCTLSKALRKRAT